MSSIVRSLGLLAALRVCSAAVLDKRDAFSIDLVASPVTDPSYPVAEVFSIWSKYNADLNVNQSLALQQYGSATTEPSENDAEYLTPVTIGNQTFMLDFDTGSSDLWVYSSLAPANETAGHTVYAPGQSASLIPGATWNISYADGSGAAGVVYADTVAVGPVTATRQAVEAATSATQFGNDGLLGLAFANINTVKPNKASPFYDTVAPTLKQRLFAANLKHDAPGSWDFGYMNSSSYTGGITFAPVVSGFDNFWTIPATHYSVGNGPFSTQSIGNAIVDSGTSIIYLTEQAVLAYYSQVDGVQDFLGSLFYFPCNTTMPDLHIRIQGVTWTVPGKYLNYAVFSGDYCLGGVQPNTGLPASILGDVFMKNFYVIFNREQNVPRVGLAQRPVGA